MAIGGVGSSCTITGNITINSSRRVLDKKFNFALEDVNSGSKVNEPLVSFSNPETGESVEIHRSDVYSDNNPLYILKGKTAEGEEFERKLHAWIIDPRNCSYAELMVLNQETGNTSAADKQRADILFEQTGVAHYLDKADYSTAMKDILDEYNKSGSWDSYLSMDNWQQSIKDYTSVPVYFNRDIMQRVTTEQNGVSTVSCSFATVRSIEDIQKEWDERIKEGEKIKTSIREVLKQNYPNAENMTWGIVGSPVEMTFDEFVKYMEEENRKWVESNKVALAK